MPTVHAAARAVRAAAPRVPRGLGVLFAGAALVTLFVVIGPSLGEPARRDVVVDNPNPYSLSVEVRDPDGGHWLRLGTVPAEATHRFSEVADRGDSWELRFSYAGVVGARLRTTGDTLAAGPVTVPTSAEQVLRNAGLTPPPP